RQSRPRPEPAPRQSRGSVSALPVPHDHELRRRLPEEPQSDARDREDQGPDGEADGVGVSDPTKVFLLERTMIDEARLRRIRWRCRRGMLENDLVLARFLDAAAASLTEDDIAKLDVLLHMTDNALWDLICGRAE